MRLLGGCSTALLPLCSASIGPTLVHDGAGNIGLLDARLTSMGVRHGALRARVYSLVGIPRDDHCVVLVVAGVTESRLVVEGRPDPPS